VTAHVAGDNKDTALISTTNNFIWAIFYAFRATQAQNYDPSREDHTVQSLSFSQPDSPQVYIYFISNSLEYRTSEIQLDLQLPSIRSEYLKIWDSDHNYVEHEVYRKGKLTRRRDYSQENGEVLVRKEIPARRVVARCRYADLADFHINWWLDKVTGVSMQGENILPTYQDAMRKLKGELTEDFLQHELVISARNIHRVCFGRDGTFSPIPWKTLYNIMIYGLMGEELKRITAVPFMISGRAAQNQGLDKDREVGINSNRRWGLKMKSVFVRMFGRGGGQ
jgi:hypothetical protein